MPYDFDSDVAFRALSEEQQRRFDSWQPSLKDAKRNVAATGGNAEYVAIQVVGKNGETITVYAILRT